MAEPTGTREPLEEERDFLLRSLDDLESERAEGNIDDATYERLHTDYTGPGRAGAPPARGRPRHARRGRTRREPEAARADRHRPRRLRARRRGSRSPTDSAPGCRARPSPAASRRPRTTRPGRPSRRPAPTCRRAPTTSTPGSRSPAP